ncbi:MAG: low-specificity L-threonine aldolase [Armatimonadota bacterium]|nr:low-specificity L-threonine aldolase [Armatimonadota bacterium]MDR7505091.1 low-specificity L-threonine aldolase [Armatimonadota bacterium]MDR7547397.1 low-specificity L-threonine aldolase [Armatimonadota bacterium]MDR7553557.1 low-specificity L-threonine aldolase [Armatimonadota bacterium]MDR7559016.1 low-specificity L-threonine aldolase [Armatimonadota bacterium]
MIDLRSDTVTQPTEAMREAMARAAVGDDVFGEDPTVNELEALAAEKMGKEAAVFVPSGTMGNLIAVMAHTQKGDAVILEAECHTYRFEVGSISAVAGVVPNPVAGVDGFITPDLLRAAVRGPNIHIPPARLLALENTHNRAGGMPFGPLEMDATCRAARQLGLAIHLDGARIFNAAVALGVPVTDLTRHVDSVMFCISKGLSAPVGSLVAGRRDFVERARRFRKMVGGGMRQAGILAAAGIVALTTMVDRLAEDHANARRLAEGLAVLRGLSVNPERVRTNMVLVDVHPPVSAAEFCARLRREGVLALPVSASTVRMVTHRHITFAMVEQAVAAAARALQ